MNDTDLLIRIKTILEGSDLQKAKTELDALISTQQRSGVESAQNAASDAALAKQKESLDKATRGATTAINSLALAANGQAGPAIAQLTRLATQLDGRLAKAGAAGLALAIGLKAGGLIDDMLHLSDAIANSLVPAIEKTGTAAAAAKKEIMGMVDAKVSGLAEDLERADRAMANLAAKAQAEREAARIRAQAEHEAKMAELFLMAPGTGRDRAEAAEKARYAALTRSADADAAKQELAAASAEKARIEEQLSTLRKQRADMKAEFEAAQKAAALPDSTDADRQRLNIASSTYRQKDPALAEAIAKLESRLVRVEASAVVAGARGEAAQIGAGTDTARATAAEREITAAADRKLAQEEMARQQAELAKLKGEKAAGVPDVLGSAREREEAEARQAEGALARFRTSGVTPEGRRISRSGTAGRNELARLEEAARKEREEANAAAERIANHAAGLGEAIRRIETSLATLSEQVKNGRTET